MNPKRVKVKAWGFVIGGSIALPYDPTTNKVVPLEQYDGPSGWPIVPVTISYELPNQPKKRKATSLVKT